MTVQIYVRDLATGEVVHTVEVNNATEQKIELVATGLLRKTNRERYYVDDVEALKAVQGDTP
jgi:Mg-chelatase subunit ChlI